MTDIPPVNSVPAEENDGPPLLARVVAGLQNAGRVVETDWEDGTFEISPPEPEEVDGEMEVSTVEPTVGVVLTHARRVVFYTVWPVTVPEDRIPAVGELVHRINTELYTSAWEFNLDSGMLSVRSGFEFDGLPDISREVEDALAYNALLEVEAVFVEYSYVISEAIAGRSATDVLAEHHGWNQPSVVGNLGGFNYAGP
ncbi:hypothetical protein D1871_05210 [Nakamurella silvestris]|nr:hypothetical protein D1871_05210 [Nakamurella silvestris]